MNTNTNFFETASRRKFRYPFKGMITTEDLWDLTPAQLDTVYKALNKDLGITQEDSLLCVRPIDDTVTDLTNKIEIVKYIFDYKQSLAEEARTAAERSVKKQHILEVLAQKQDTALQNMSEEELMKMLNDL